MLKNRKSLLLPKDAKRILQGNGLTEDAECALRSIANGRSVVIRKRDLKHIKNAQQAAAYLYAEKGIRIEVEGIASFNSGFNIAKDTASYFCLDYARKCLENDNEEAEDVAMYLSEAISKISSPY